MQQLERLVCINSKLLYSFLVTIDFQFLILQIFFIALLLSVGHTGSIPIVLPHLPTNMELTDSYRNENLQDCNFKFTSNSICGINGTVKTGLN